MTNLLPETSSIHWHSIFLPNAVKREMGVPGQFQSCHTAQVGDYVIEGHLPENNITRLMKEKLPVKGLAVPGMPQGSPGMQGREVIPMKC